MLETKPDCKKCLCGVLLEPFYVEEIWHTTPNGMKFKMPLTGQWSFKEKCDNCVVLADKKIKEENERYEKEEYDRIRRQAISRCGFRPREMSIVSKETDFKKNELEIMNLWLNGNKALYIHGGVGTGKTHFAVAALYKYIMKTGSSGKFKIVANLINELRQAVPGGHDGEIISEMVHAPALVLDDIAVERPTGYVLEAMYLILDGWYGKMSPMLIITSNLTMSELAAKLDDRIASRLSAMCDIVEFHGKDRRLK